MAMRESFEHFELFQYLQSNWQSFDAYSGACATLCGYSLLLFTCAHLGSGAFLVKGQWLLGYTLCIVPIIASTIVIRLDLWVTKKEIKTDLGIINKRGREITRK